MQVDFSTFIALGRFGDIGLGTPWSEVRTLLGEPRHFEPPGAGTPALAQYGSLEFAIAEGRVAMLSLRVSETTDVPATIALTNVDGLHLDEAQVDQLLSARGVTWTRIELLCDDWTDSYKTANSVYLSFGGGLLAKVGLG